MSEEAHADIRRLLEAHHTLTLATAQAGSPWAATVFYASDAELNLYFVSDARTRHARELLADSRAAIAIHTDVDNWHAVQGLQIEAEARRLGGIDQARAMALYLARFVSVKTLFDAPASADEQTIAARLRQADFWCARPRFIRLIDNSRGFGFRHELKLP